MACARHSSHPSPRGSAHRPGGASTGGKSAPGMAAATLGSSGRALLVTEPVLALSGSPELMTPPMLASRGRLRRVRPSPSNETTTSAHHHACWECWQANSLLQPFVKSHCCCIVDHEGQHRPTGLQLISCAKAEVGPQGHQMSIMHLVPLCCGDHGTICQTATSKYHTPDAASVGRSQVMGLRPVREADSENERAAMFFQNICAAASNTKAVALQLSSSSLLLRQPLK